MRIENKKGGKRTQTVTADEDDGGMRRRGKIQRE
jgi:hypothetical protein